MKNAIKPLAKSVLIQLGLTAASASDVVIHKKSLEFGNITLIILNDEKEGIMKIVESP